jgi:hypothetical protein
MSSIKILFFLPLIFGILTVSIGDTSVAWADVSFKDCSKKDKSKIKDALSWLKKNMKKIDKKMGKNRLMDWPGKSRSKFVAKLSKNLKFVCKNSKKKCKPKKDGTILLGKVVPVFKQKTIQLCTNNFFDGSVNYVSTIAHEIAHLIRLNAHRTDCVKKYKNPRFSKSVGLAVYHAYLNKAYNYKSYITRCK